MNKYSLIILVCLCSFLIFCTNSIKYKEYRINDLTKPISDTLKADNVGRVIGVEILIDGEINGEATLDFENGSGRFSRIYLKGKINQTYETEWYSSKMFFKFTPITIIQGDSLKLSYRMY